MSTENNSKDINYMSRAMDLALLGRGYVSPNPLVGCVVVHNDSIIGEGYHRRFGEAHAEVNAINSVADQSLLPEATVYVNLEPCSHYGKTPPCADFLIKHHVKKVVVANLDTNPLVSGKGMQKLKNAGIEVASGIMEEEGKNLNKRFFTFMQKMRPYIILKWAQTIDGFIARENYDSKWISNELSRKLVHKWRTEEDAILVGTNTALHDNPRLNVRDWTGRSPLRAVIDRNLRLPTDLHLFDGTQPTLCYNTSQASHSQQLEYVKLKEEDFLRQLVDDLYFRKVQSVIVEGGSGLINQLLARDLWDEIRIFMAPACFGKGIAAPVPQGKLIYRESIRQDQLYIYRREDGY